MKKRHTFRFKCKNTTHPDLNVKIPVIRNQCKNAMPCFPIFKCKNAKQSDLNEKMLYIPI